jgi:ATP synthase protein I
MLRLCRHADASTYVWVKRGFLRRFTHIIVSFAEIVVRDRPEVHVKTLPPPLPDEEIKEEAFRRYSRQEAEQLRKASPQVSPWRVVLWMLVAAVVIGSVSWLSFDLTTALSAAYGSLVVSLPAAVLARGMTSPLSRMNVTAGAMAFMLWEMVKIGLSIGMLMLAPNLIAGLNWPALLVGLILTMKVYFVAALYKPKVTEGVEERSPR